MTIRTMLVVKDRPGSYARDDRATGLFSYAVPGWTWHHVVLGPRFAVNTQRWASAIDLIVHIDGSNWGTYRGPVPVVYVAIDSTLSEAHGAARVAQARQADLVLVDHDRPDRFVDRHGRPGVAFPYCVNDRLFRPLVPVGDDRPIEIAYAMGWTGPGRRERRQLAQALADYGQRNGRRVDIGPRPVADYAALLGQSQIVVNWPRTPENRPHRVFDAMAAGACLVTGPLPPVPDDHRVAGRHYVEAPTVDAVVDAVDVALGVRGAVDWRSVAAAGYDLVSARHTWAQRSQELRLIVASYLGVGR